MLPSGSGGQLCSPLGALLWRWIFAMLVYWDFHTRGLFLCPTPFLWGRVSVPSAPCAVSVLWRFAVCFSVLWDSLAWGAKLQFAVCYSGFLGGWVCPWAVLVYTEDGWGILRDAWCLPVLNVSQEGLKLAVAAAAVVAALKFSQCSILWGSFSQSRGSGCWRFDSSWCFISDW
jgi:hypothetical protein